LSFIKPTTTRIYKVGILCGFSYFCNTVDGLTEKLKEMGYIEGENIDYFIERTNDPEYYKNVTQKFLDEKVDVIVVFPTEAAMEAKKVVQGRIPIVFADSFTEGNDLIDNISKPGVNITGVRWATADIALKNFEILLSVMPNCRKIWIPYMADSNNAQIQIAEIRISAKDNNVTLIEVPANSFDDVIADMEMRASTNVTDVDAVILLSDTIPGSPEIAPKIVDFWKRRGVPTVTAINFGGIFTLLPDNVEAGEFAALLVHKILRGQNAGEIPVMTQETKVIVNYNATQEFKSKLDVNLLLEKADVIMR